MQSLGLAGSSRETVEQVVHIPQKKEDDDLTIMRYDTQKMTEGEGASEFNMTGNSRLRAKLTDKQVQKINNENEKMKMTDNDMEQSSSNSTRLEQDIVNL